MRDLRVNIRNISRGLLGVQASKRAESKGVFIML